MSVASRRLTTRSVRRLLTAWSLVRVRPGEPNLKRVVGDTTGGLFLLKGDRRLSQKIKGLAEAYGQFAPFQVQFETMKLRRRRFSRGSCFSNRRCAFCASSRSCTPFSM